MKALPNFYAFNNQFIMKAVLRHNVTKRRKTFHVVAIIGRKDESDTLGWRDGDQGGDLYELPYYDYLSPRKLEHLNVKYWKEINALGRGILPWVEVLDTHNKTIVQRVNCTIEDALLIALSRGLCPLGPWKTEIRFKPEGAQYGDWVRLPLRHYHK